MIVHKLCDVVDPQASHGRVTQATLPLCEYIYVVITEVYIYVCSTLSVNSSEMGIQ